MAGIVNAPIPAPKAPETPEVFDTAKLIHEDGFNYQPKHVFNPPPDKKLLWRGPLAEKRGQAADWPVYTEDMLITDYKLFGTRLAQPYRLEGNRMVNGISWLVFRPIALVQRQEAARIERQNLTMRTFPEGQRGKSKLVTKGRTQFDVSQDARED